MSMTQQQVPRGWDLIPFGNLVTLSQYGLSESANGEGSVPMLRMLNISDGRLYTSKLVYLDLDESEKRKYLLQKNDLLFNRTNSENLVGKTSLFDRDGDYVFASYLVRFKTDSDKVCPQFLSYVFNSYRGQAKIKKLSTKGVSQCNINPTNLQKYFEILLPPLLEQKKIAEILSCWDKAIEITGKLIEAKVKLKKGLMQELLSGGMRFPVFESQQLRETGSIPSGWSRMKLRQFLTPASRPVAKPSTRYRRLGLRNRGQGTFITEDADPSKISMDTLYEIRANELIVNITFAWEGSITVTSFSDEGALVSHRFPTYSIDDHIVLAPFIRLLTTTSRFVYLLGLISPGGAGRNRVMSKKDFLKLEVIIPPVEEQRRICELLCGVESEILLLTELLGSYQDQKKGLMQKLLTGQIRV